ncbi:SHOCT domain-containing protein [Streptomyces oryzae]|uniref:SHOCT domain-containing protein n=1 Tax=Streptomyces oryzae TaxID=1434886 RepID=A0ABS3X5B5_9ACTN|nr:SHOCT domain-containing protein [Streptomyces oryzae]MBO8190524.1 SHOCT domain-containing protein [Streptomyces oryzae]
MMFWYGHGIGGWGWFAMSASMIVFWALVIGIGALIFRAVARSHSGDSERPQPQPHAHPSPGPTPEQLLRFALGEIDEEEYRRRLSTLCATPPHWT